MQESLTTIRTVEEKEEVQQLCGISHIVSMMISSIHCVIRTTRIEQRSSCQWDHDYIYARRENRCLACLCIRYVVSSKVTIISWSIWVTHTDHSSSCRWVSRLYIPSNRKRKHSSISVHVSYCPFDENTYLLCNKNCAYWAQIFVQSGLTTIYTPEEKIGV